VRTRVGELLATGAVRPLFGTEVVAIAADHVMLRGASGIEQLANDHVVIQIGGTAPSQLLHSIGIELVEKRGEA
jgi:thioredoxin reductase